MKKLIIVAILSIPSMLFAQAAKITPYVCSYSVDGKTYKADEHVIRRYANLEQQILRCEATGVQVVVTNPKKVTLGFDFNAQDKKGKMAKVPKEKMPVDCNKVNDMLIDWNSSIATLMGSEIKHPIEILVTILSIRQTIRDNEIPNSKDENVNAWKFFRDNYANLILEEFDYPYMLIERERGGALEQDGDDIIKVSNETLEDDEKMDLLVTKIAQNKTLEAILNGKTCEVMEESKCTVKLPDQKSFTLPEKEKKEKENKKDDGQNNNGIITTNDDNAIKPPQYYENQTAIWRGTAEGSVAVEVTVVGNNVNEIVYGSDMVTVTGSNPFTGSVNVDGVDHTIEVTINGDKIELKVDGKTVEVSK